MASVNLGKSSSATKNKSPMAASEKYAAASIKAINQSRLLSYVIYKHRQELKRRNSPFMDMAHSKLTLTIELLRKAMKNTFIGKSSPETLQIFDREKIFAKNLIEKMELVKNYQLTQMTQLTQQRKQHLLKLRQEQQQQSQPHQKGHHEAKNDTKGRYIEKADNLPQKINMEN